MKRTLLSAFLLISAQGPLAAGDSLDALQGSVQGKSSSQPAPEASPAAGFKQVYAPDYSFFPTPVEDGDCPALMALARPMLAGPAAVEACRGMDAGCLVSLARARPDWPPATLRSACPSSAARGRKDDKSCVGRLAAAHPDWNMYALKAVCDGKDGNCIAGLAKARPKYNGFLLRELCPSADAIGGKETRACTARLAAARPAWTAVALKETCRDKDGECVFNLARSQPAWPPLTLRGFCPAASASVWDDELLFE